MTFSAMIKFRDDLGNEYLTAAVFNNPATGFEEDRVEVTTVEEMKEKNLQLQEFNIVE